MSSSAPSTAPTSTTTRSLHTPDTLQLEVLEDDDDTNDPPIDEELVLATAADDDDEELDGHHVRQKKSSRFSLPRISLGRKGKGKYSRVTAEHIATTASSKSAQPVVRPASGANGDQPPSSSFMSSAGLYGERPHKPCFTCFNACLFFSLCLTIFLAGFIGYTIGRRSLTSSSHPRRPPPLIVLSLDGFASTYLNTHRALLPNITALVASGLSALPLTPVFPSSTFPNHYTLITGLYPTEHGIVANRMYNASTGEWFIVGGSLTNASYWWLGEPVWSTAQQRGLTSAVLNWPGSDKVIGGRRPNVWAPYNGSISDSNRVQQLMTWLDEGACTLCMVYFSSVDSAGHQYGPQSPYMDAELAAMDATVGSVVSGLHQRGLWDSVNLLIVSDHGMTSVNTTMTTDNARLRFIESYTNVTDYMLVHWGTFAHILPTNDTTAQQLYTDLTHIDNCTAYYADATAIPVAYHYNFSMSARIQPIVLICDLGITVTNRVSTLNNEKGAHGYLGTDEGMGAILLLHGAGVDREEGVNVTLTGTKSVDVYGLMCKLLGVTAAHNEGDMKQFDRYLNYTYR